MDLHEFLMARIAEDETWIRSNGDWLDDCQECAFGQQPESPYSQARVLAEIQAKRRTVELEGCYACSDAWRPCEHKDMTVRLLALPYADHPDYRREWAR